MIRRTVGRAFGRKAEGQEDIPPETVPLESSRLKRMQHIFAELRDAFCGALDEAGYGHGAKAATKGKNDTNGSKRPSTTGRRRTKKASRVTEIRPESDGHEFTVQASRVTYHLRHTMNGFIWIFREEKEQDVERLGMLCLQPDEAGIPQLIEKSLEPGRTPFHFTSIPRIVGSLLANEANQRA